MSDQINIESGNACLPCKILHTKHYEYNPYWIEDYSYSALMHVARDYNERLMPHCLVLSVSPGKVVDLFDIVTPSEFMLTMLVFRNNNELLNFMATAENRILSAIDDSGKELI